LKISRKRGQHSRPHAPKASITRPTTPFGECIAQHFSYVNRLGDTSRFHLPDRLFLGKRGVFAGTDSNALFKFIANISAPAIILSIVITTDLGNLDATLVGLYLISELLIYGLGYFICRKYIYQKSALSILNKTNLLYFQREI
jgi:hypothetical protein